MWSSLYKPAIGGEERYTERLVAGLVRAGCSVEVVTNTVDYAPVSELIDGIQVTRLPFPASRRGDFAAIKSVRDGLRGVVERLRPEVVNLQTSGPSIAYYELHRRALPTPLVTTFHGIYPPAANGGLQLSNHLARCAAGIAASFSTKASLVAVAGDAAAHLDVRLPSIDDDQQPIVRAPSASAMILGVGRLVAEKGWHTLFDALPLVIAAVPAARVVLVGDGPERKNLQALVAARNLAPFVRFTGFISDDELRGLLDECNVVCVPSHIEEGFGMVAIEASIRARAVVASRSGGLVEAVSDGVTGVLVPVADAPALADALIRVLRDPELAERLGRAGRAFASTLTVDALTAATLQTFQRALAGGSR